MTKQTKAELPSKEQILQILADDKTIKGKRDLARAFNIRGKLKAPFRQLLREMKQEGLLSSALIKGQKNNYLPSISVIKIAPESESDNLYAYPLKWNEALGEKPKIHIKPSRKSHIAPSQNDLVLAKISKENSTYYASILKILNKPQAKQLAIVRFDENGAYLEPINRRQRRIMLEKGEILGAKNGDLVEIEVKPKGRLMIESAKIVKIIGNPQSQGAISLIAIYNHEIPHIFPPKTIKEANSLKLIGLDNRQDWRDIPFITIDPENAKDHDDAVYAQPDNDKNNIGGHKIYVAIADVSAYVKYGSAIDEEAYLRGNSVYFPDMVVPMLPENISNNLCSLKENEDRAAICLEMIFDKEGKKISHSFCRALIRSRKKLTYSQAQSAFDNKPDEQTKPILENILKPLYNAYQTIKIARDKRAPLDLDLPERRIVLDKDGMVERVFVPKRLEAHRLIEEIMILANICAAQTLEEHKSALLYRIHDKPDEEKLKALREFLLSLNMSFIKSPAVKTQHFNQTLKLARENKNIDKVSEMILRSQSQAQYSPQNIGHFGLNLAKYAHFTSPIRRYSDLIIHRALILALKLGNDGLSQEQIEKMAQIGEHLSFCERRAMAAERETIDRLIALYMAQKVNSTFKGTISGLIAKGIFVRLDENGADGFVPISTLGDDYYHYIEEQQAIIGEKTHERFGLGDEVIVKLVEVLPMQASLKFEIISKGEIVTKSQAQKLLNSRHYKKTKYKRRRRK